MSANLSSPRRPLQGRALAIALAIAAFAAVGTLDLGSSAQAQEAPAKAKPPQDHAAALTLLKQNCVRCHTDEKRKGGLLMTSREALLEGGDTDAAIVPGKPAESFLVETLPEDADPHMPPKDQFDADEIALVTRWVADGAPWNDQLWASIPAQPERGPIEMRSLPASYAPVMALALSPDGKVLAAGHGSRICLFEVGEKELKLTAILDGGHRDTVQALAWSADGKTIASGGFRRLVLWQVDAKGAKVKHSIESDLKGRITALAFTKDGKTLIAADSVAQSSAHLLFIDPASAKLQARLEAAHDDSVYSLALSPDGKMLASASGDTLVKLWDLATRKYQRTFEGHIGFALGVSFSPESDRLATAGDDETVKVWRVSDGNQISTFGTTTTGPVTGVDWRIDAAKAKLKADEKDEKKATEIKTDRIFTINEHGRPRVYTDLVEHEGEQRSKGATEKAHDDATAELVSLALSEDHRLFAGSVSGELIFWDPAGKILHRQLVPSELPPPPAPPAPAKEAAPKTASTDAKPKS